MQDEFGLGRFVHGARGELDLTEMLATGAVRVRSTETAPAPAAAPAPPAAPVISEAVLAALRANDLSGVLTEAVAWPKTLDKQVALLDEMFAEVKTAVDASREGVKPKADDLVSRRETVIYLVGRLHSHLGCITDGTWRLSEPNRFSGGY